MYLIYTKGKIKMKDTILNFLKSFFHKNSQNTTICDSYSNKLESIDCVDLAKNFEKMLKTNKLNKHINLLLKKYEENLDTDKSITNYPLQTKLTRSQSLNLAQSFFKSIDSNLSNKVNNIILGNYCIANGQRIYLSFNTYDEFSKNRFNFNPMSYMPTKDSNDMFIYVPVNGDLSDLYSLVHELSHSFDSQNGNTDTRRILGEVVPLCMERMLDEFLINLSDEDKEANGIVNDILEKDIKNRRITTFISRYDNIVFLNKRFGNDEIHSRYLLSQIYQTQFMKFDSNDKKEKIKSFIDCVINDDFDGANNVFGLKINKNNSLLRDMYVSNTVQEFNQILTPPVTGTNSKRKQNTMEIVFEK